jgi:hypothetical protein
MAFSQELKVEAYRRGFRCAEMPIPYFPRGGETKNRTVVDGIGNLGQLIAARLRPAAGQDGVLRVADISTGVPASTVAAVRLAGPEAAPKPRSRTL